MEISTRQVLVCRFYNESKTDICNYSMELDASKCRRNEGVEGFFKDLINVAYKKLNSLGDPQHFIEGIVLYKETFGGFPDVFRIEYKADWVIYREEEIRFIRKYTYYPKYQVENGREGDRRILPNGINDEKFKEFMDQI